jgi:hypothetical protein
VPPHRPSTDEIVWALGYVQPPIQAEFGANACIVATRVALEVLRHYRVRVQPLAVHVEVWNPAAVEAIDRGEDPAELGPPCRVMQLGFTDQPQPDDTVDMHVVVAVEDRLLLDLTLDQCSAPEHGIELPPGIFHGLPPKFVRGGRVDFRVKGCQVVYEAHPDEKGYLIAPDWTDRSRRQPFVEATLARLRDG